MQLCRLEYKHKTHTKCLVVPCSLALQQRRSTVALEVTSHFSGVKSVATSLKSVATSLKSVATSLKSVATSLKSVVTSLKLVATSLKSVACW